MAWLNCYDLPSLIFLIFVIYPILETYHSKRMIDVINKEILEIKKLIKVSPNSSMRLCGCYVTGEENKKVTYINDYISNMPDSEQHKFVEIIRKTLSGSLGKNLHNLSFNEVFKDTDRTEGTDNSEDNSFNYQLSLLALLETELKNDETLDAFYDHVIENFDFAGNYLILLTYDVYDVPVKTKDNIKLDDSTEVFKYMLCCICPVNLSKAALSYHEETNSIENRVRDWIVEAPCMGFMFPSFNERSADIHSLLYYVKNTKDMYSGFIANALGCIETMPSDKQKQLFNEMIEDVVVNQPEYEVVDIVRDINENITDMIENNTGNEAVSLNKDDIKDLFRQSGIKEEDLEKVDKKFSDEINEDMLFSAESIQEKKKFEVKTNDVVINVKPEHSHIVKIKMVDGIKCLVVPMDTNVEINGIMSEIRQQIENNIDK